MNVAKISKSTTQVTESKSRNQIRRGRGNLLTNGDNCEIAILLLRIEKPEKVVGGGRGKARRGGDGREGLVRFVLIVFNLLY